MIDGKLEEEPTNHNKLEEPTKQSNSNCKKKKKEKNRNPEMKRPEQNREPHPLTQMEKALD